MSKSLQEPKYIFNISLYTLLVGNFQGIYDMQRLAFELFRCRSKVKVCNFSMVTLMRPLLLAEAPYIQQAKDLAFHLFSNIQVKLKKSSKKVKLVLTYENCECVLIRYTRFLNSCKNPKFIFKEFYSFLSDPCFLLYIYSVIQMRKLNLGIGSLTLAGILKVATELKSHVYRVNPIRRVLISTPIGNAHSFGVASPKDNLIQYAVFFLLDSYLDRIFLRYSHGFRSGKSTYTCLQSMAKEWRGLS